jgi:hypothetical protein
MLQVESARFGCLFELEKKKKKEERNLFPVQPSKNTSKAKL